MTTKPLIMLSALALLLGTTAAAAETAGEVQLAATFTNTFERPAAGSAYTLDQWAADGWNAPWELGMASRTRIDTAVQRSGTKSLRVLYPKGKIGPQDSGVSAPFTIPKAREYWVRQWVRFSPDFSWGTTQFAGKVGIGIAGGASCSGGGSCTGYNGFTSRFIWRSGGKAAIYVYHMGKTSEYGDHRDLMINGQLVYFPRGQWAEIKQRVRVNTVTDGNANPDGEVQVWFNGQPAGLMSGLRFVRNADQVDRAYFSSFAGGGDLSFAPMNDSYIWYDDVRVSTTPI